MSNKVRSIKRGQKPGVGGIEKLAATARVARQVACAKEIAKSNEEILKRHNCHSQFVVGIMGQQVPIVQVLNFPVALQIIANVEE